MDVHPGQESAYSQVRTTTTHAPFAPDVHEIMKGSNVDPAHPLYKLLQEAIERTLKDELGADKTVDVPRSTLEPGSRLLFVRDAENVEVGQNAVIKAAKKIHQVRIGEGAEVR